MPGTDKRKQSLYFPEDMLNEIQAEANRQDRSLSWIVQQAWRIARGRDHAFPVRERRALRRRARGRARGEGQLASPRRPAPVDLRARAPARARPF